MSFSRPVVREVSVDVMVVSLLSRLRMRFVRAVVDVADVNEPAVEAVDFILAPEDDGRGFVGEVLELEDISLPIDASSACKLDSAEASAFFSFCTRSRNYKAPVSLNHLPRKEKIIIPSEDSASSTSPLSSATTAQNSSAKSAAQSRSVASPSGPDSSTERLPGIHCLHVSEASAEDLTEASYYSRLCHLAYSALQTEECSPCGQILYGVKLGTADAAAVVWHGKGTGGYYY